MLVFTTSISKHSKYISNPRKNTFQSIWKRTHSYVVDDLLVDQCWRLSAGLSLTRLYCCRCGTYRGHWMGVVRVTQLGMRAPTHVKTAKWMFIRGCAKTRINTRNGRTDMEGHKARKKGGQWSGGTLQKHVCGTEQEQVGYTRAKELYTAGQRPNW
jgi:hypothetical protein